MYQQGDEPKHFKKIWIVAAIPFIMLAMDYLIYEQKKLLRDEEDVLVLNTVFCIAVVGTVACLLLVLGAALLYQQGRKQRHDRQYADEIVRKFFVPVNGIIGVAEQLCSSGTLAAEQAQQAELIAESSRRIKRMLHDIDEYNALKSGLVKLQMQSFNLQELAGAVIHQIESQKPPSPIRLVNAVPPGIFVRASSKKLQEIVGNLIVVLINYTPQGTVTISARGKAAYVEVKIEDDGVGVAEHIKNSLFDPIDGANNISNGHYSGTGFSLAIAKELVELHKGRIWIDKSLRDTTAVYFTLLKDDNLYRMPVTPFTDLNLPRDTGKRIQTAALARPEGRILLLKVASTHKNILISLLTGAGYAVDAPEMTQLDMDRMPIDEYYDLLVIDELLDYSGFSLCAAVRKRYGYTQLPILLIVPNDRQANLERAYQAGANDCIDYLVMPQQLMAKIKTLVQIKKATQEALEFQMSLLQAQIQPHFLYNALNVITQLCLDDPQRAHDVLLDFSQYLRSKFRFRQANRAILVSDELCTIESYLRVEQARFGKRLQYTICTNQTEEYLIPALIIEPLVENAVKHGISKMEHGGKVQLTLRTEAGQLWVEVADNGPGMSRRMVEAVTKGVTAALGTGMSNIMKRLKLYGGGPLQAESVLGKGTRIWFTLPLSWNQFYAKEQSNDTSHPVGR
ncbi:ATP-binding protein [Allofournierella sp.]|uniref:ATP-binding protein n=1 Tax=Allofournierella sp. TaxID=1940256 RepID=UPI003AB6A23F